MVRIEWTVAALFAIVMLGPVLAGCLSQDTLETVAPGEHYRFTDRDVTETNLSVEGSFLIAEHGIPLCLTRQEELYTTPVDLTEILPVDVPVLLNVTLRHLSQEPADITGWFEGEGAWTGETQRPIGGNPLRFTTTAYRPDEGAKLHFIVAGDIPNTAAEHEWELTAQIYPLVKSIPSAFPVAFEVHEPDTPPFFDSLDRKNASFLLWAPDERFLGAFHTNRNAYAPAIQENGPGHYVVYAPTSKNQLTIHAQEDTRAQRLEALQIAETHGPLSDPALEEWEMWEFELEKVPLAAALAVRSKDPRVSSSASPHFRLETPLGSVLEDDGYSFQNTGVSLDEQDLRWTLVLEAGDPDLTTGRYEASWKSSGHWAEATHVILDYVR